MEALIRAYGQLVELAKSMSLAARLGALAIGGVVIAGLLYLSGQSSESEQVLLMGGESFASSQLSVMAAAFAKAGLEDYQIDATRVRVPADKQSVYMGALADAGALPPTFGQFLEQAVRPNLLRTSNQQYREAMIIAKQNELQSIIGQMQGIETASVLSDVEETRGFGNEKIRTASVSVKPRAGCTLTEHQADMIRSLVVHAIAGLKPESVNITDLSGRSDPAQYGAAGTENEYGRIKRQFEKDWSEKITRSLGHIPGVQVTSNVELGVEGEPEEAPEEGNSSGASPRSTPLGTVWHEVMGSEYPPDNRVQESTSQPDRTISTASGARRPKSLAGDNKSRTRMSPHLAPKRVTVAVTIPSGYYDQVWRAQHVSGHEDHAARPRKNEVALIESDVKDDVRQLVAKLLPEQAPGVDSLSRVTVTTFQQLTQVEPSSEPVDPVWDWLKLNGGALGLAGMGLVGLVALRSLIQFFKPKGSAISDEHVVLREPVPTTISMQDEAGNSSSRVRPQNMTGSLREELSHLVSDDPDAAARVLRSWIGKAG